MRPQLARINTRITVASRRSYAPIVAESWGQGPVTDVSRAPRFPTRETYVFAGGAGGFNRRIRSSKLNPGPGSMWVAPGTSECPTMCTRSRGML